MRNCPCNLCIMKCSHKECKFCKGPSELIAKISLFRIRYFSLLSCKVSSKLTMSLLKVAKRLSRLSDRIAMSKSSTLQNERFGSDTIHQVSKVSDIARFTESCSLFCTCKTCVKTAFDNNMKGQLKRNIFCTSNFSLSIF